MTRVTPRPPLRSRRALPLAITLFVALPAVARAQPMAGRDTLHLAALHARAVARAPRARQLELLAAQSALRERGLDAEQLPTIDVSAQGQYQSDVVALPFQLPGGVAVPLPPHDQYDAHVGARERLYDPTRAARRDVERARLAESQARVHTSLFALRERVSDAYFAALDAAARRAALETGITDLEARLAVARDRVRLGAALPSDSAALEAELLRQRQSLAELDADRRAALAVLGSLTGSTIDDSVALALPDLRAEVAQARAGLTELRARPEYAQFARSRELLDRERASATAAARPSVSAFARAGYGRPGLNPLARDFDAYWLAGVQVAWTPWSWGATTRQQQELALQARIVATEEAAFTEETERGVATDLAQIDRLERTLATDDTIVALRERILRETQLRYGEGVITSAEYVDRATDVLAARLARAAHRVALARSRARFLTLVGLEIR